MSSLVRSFASLYSQKLRSTTRLGPVTTAPPRFQALNLHRRGRRETSAGSADAEPAVPIPTTEADAFLHLGKIGRRLYSCCRYTIPAFQMGVVPAYSETSSGEVEMVKDTAEGVAEVVEEAATVAEKVSSEVAEQVPENGRLRAAAVLLEHASKEVAEQVDEIEEDVKAIMNHSKHAHAETRLTAQQSIKTEGNQKKGKDF